MRPSVILLVFGLLLAGCTPTATTRELQPSTHTNEAALTNLGLAVEYMRRGEYDKALEKLEKARRADPAYPLTYNTYGVLYQQLGDMQRAEHSFKRALQLDPNNSATMNNYGRYLCQRGQPKEAEETFLRAAANPLYETPEIPIANAGTCALGDGRPDDAEKFFRSALERNPKIPGALLNMAQLSFAQGRYLPARGYLQRYIVAAKHTAESLWLGIQIEQQLGDKDAVSSYALLLRNSFPDSEQAGMLRESGAK
ncbi:MAG: type IV pilus biogenesis/stability protein PilW [Gammaproteobacteria bacterium]|nr:type IV pilus biogenesis/stability protein PilW [Gammaproteobacteria bacterium]